MLAQRYARWLDQNQPSVRTRAAILASALSELSRPSGRRVPPELWLLELAEGTSCSEAMQIEVPSSETGDLIEDRSERAHALGRVLDTLLAVESIGSASGERVLRRRLGSYYTPREVARALVGSATASPLLRRCATARLADEGPGSALSVCDPAMGGGAFLVEAGRALALDAVGRGKAPCAALRLAVVSLHGMDVSRLAVATAQAALWLLTDEVAPAERLRVVDALDRQAVGSVTFDWVVGNPPWVSFQGRATQRISKERRAELRTGYEAFRGYPTLHGVFLERATELASRGLVSLLLPSSLSDLDGYRSARRCLRRSHVPLEPLNEFGEDAFPGVVQPCFGLVAEARSGEETSPATDEPFRLEERVGTGARAREVEPPRCLLLLAQQPRLPSGCFAELGFQSNRVVTSTLFLRAPSPSPPFELPLLEGRRVQSFRVGLPALFLDGRPEALARANVRLRDAERYRQVEFVVRQTAAFTIAARHPGHAFRNSLLAGFGQEDLDADLLVGLLNSSLYRAFHLSMRRDARQATFPQVKVAHLRHLPLPPPDMDRRERVRQLSRQATGQGPSDELLRRLDEEVFRLFEIEPQERQEVENFLRDRAPRALRV